MFILMPNKYLLAEWLIIWWGGWDETDESKIKVSSFNISEQMKSKYQQQQTCSSFENNIKMMKIIPLPTPHIVLWSFHAYKSLTYYEY